jgi:hypothetical protein
LAGAGGLPDVFGPGLPVPPFDGGAGSRVGLPGGRFDVFDDGGLGEDLLAGLPAGLLGGRPGDFGPDGFCWFAICLA